MQLSKRLERVANLVTPNSIVADIGCDHAYISIYLIEQGISPKVIAMDVNKGPLAKANENIIRASLSDVIETRLSNGIEKLNEGEVDTILLAGMGGILMTEILSAKPAVIDQVKELVLQPQSDIDLVREHVMKLGFTIMNEDMLIDEGKYYTMMKAVRHVDGKDDETSYRMVELVYGRVLLRRKHQILFEYLMREKEKAEEIMLSIVSESDSAKEAREKLLSKLELIKEALCFYNE